MDLIEILRWYPILTILISIPWLCWYDYKYREIPDSILNRLFLLNIPLFVITFFAEQMTYMDAIVILVPVVIYYVLMRLHFFEGDDFMILAMISIFCINNPLGGTIPVKMMLYLAGVVFFVACCNFAYNLGHLALLKRDYPFDPVFETPSITSLANMTSDGRGFPMMIPISIAFVLTIIL